LLLKRHPIVLRCHEVAQFALYRAGIDSGYGDRMMTTTLRPRVLAIFAITGLTLALAGCSTSAFSPNSGPVASAALEDFAQPTPEGSVPRASEVPAAPAALAYAGGSLDGLISHYAEHYAVPEPLVRRVIERESGYNPGARNGPFYGLMQVSHATASGMGYRGSPTGLLDPETNLRYAVRYLAGAYVTAGGNDDQAVRFYARGYYYDAKAAGLLQKSGLR
jgi:soluble lytic murein transglycosylase-like protein